MGFFKKRKARKLAEQQAKAALEQKKADELLAKNQKESIKKETVKPTVKVTQKVEPKKEPVKKEPVLEPTKKETKSVKYHVSQNKDPRSDNHRNWRVRKEGSEKTIKFFSTQKEAIEYAESLATTAGSSVVIHKIDGSIRKQSYTKKD